ARLGREAGASLSVADALEAPVPREEGRHDHEPADRDGHDRDDRADIHAGRIAQLPVDLVVPNDVVDPERHQRPKKNQERVPDLPRRPTPVHLFSHVAPPSDSTGYEDANAASSACGSGSSRSTGTEADL